MKRTVSILLFLSIFSQAFAEITVISGVYQGADLYVKNPFAPDGVGFCVFEVLVNGDISTDEVNSSAFEIDLSLYNFSIGDPIEVVIRSKADCAPAIINPEAISPKSTFVTEKIEIQDGNILTWTTSGEQGSLPFKVEQYKWNKWVTVGEVNGYGTTDPHEYNFEVYPVAGKNKFRVVQRDLKGTRNSPEALWNSPHQEVKMLHSKVFDQIEFDRETQFEVYNEYGTLIAKGFGNRINLTHHPDGRYYVNYDAIFGAVVVKK